MASKTDSKVLSKWARLRELLLNTLVGGLPTIFLGVILRRILYRLILAHMGESVFIQDGVELINTSIITLGNGVHLFRGIRIDGGCSANNKILIQEEVAIERGVDVGALDDTKIVIGARTFIGPYTCIAGPGDITIGENCMIAAHCGIFANNHDFSDPTQLIREQGVSRKGICIESDCWLGHKVTVLDGVRIGKGSVIGAGAVVSRNIPPYSIAVGVPAKVVKRRGGDLPQANGDLRQLAQEPSS